MIFHLILILAVGKSIIFSWISYSNLDRESIDTSFDEEAVKDSDYADQEEEQVIDEQKENTIEEKILTTVSAIDRTITEERKKTKGKRKSTGSNEPHIPLYDRLLNYGEVL